MARNSAPPLPVRTHQNPAANFIPPELQELSIFDQSKPYSLVNLVSDEFRAHMAKIPLDLFAITEAKFIAQHAPDETDYRLRLKFWDEWQLSLLTPGRPAPIRVPAVYYGVCTREFFYQKILKDPVKLAWMITPPTDYDTTLKELLYRGLGRLREIIALPFVQEVPVIHRGQPVMKPDGTPLTTQKVDRGLVSEVRQVIAMLSDRVHGAIVSRIDVKQQSLNLTASISGADAAAAFNPADPLPSLSTDLLKQLDAQIDSIDARLKPLEGETHVTLDANATRTLKQLGINPKDVHPEEISAAIIPRSTDDDDRETDHPLPEAYGN